MENWALFFGVGFTAALIQGIIQLILWVLNRKAAKADKVSSTDERIKRAIRIILYDRIKYLGRRHLEEGIISHDDLEDIMTMHKCYHDDFDGNGFLDGMIKQVQRLPLKKRQREQSDERTTFEAVGG